MEQDDAKFIYFHARAPMTPLFEQSGDVIVRRPSVIPQMKSSVFFEKGVSRDFHIVDVAISKKLEVYVSIL